MSKAPILKNYVSSLDKFLQKWDEEHPRLSQSQLKEKEKYARIYYLRDQANRPEEKKLPEDF